MCRLFGAISQRRIDAGYLLQDASQSLLRQSRIDRKHPQDDGWGIGWFEKGRPRIFKSPNPIYKELPIWNFGFGKGSLHKEPPLPNSISQIRHIRSRCVVGHVRWASNPLKLPKKELIGLAHSQPFSFGKWLFAHNGTLLIPKEVRAALGPLAKQIKGNNDSEVLFYWLLKHLPRLRSEKIRFSGRPIYLSIKKSLKNLDLVWKQCRKRYPLYKYPYHGLNWVLTNGKILVAMCYVNPGGFGKARALCQHQKPYYQLHHKLDGQGWVVASEPLDDSPRWEPFRHGEILIADATGGQWWEL